MPTPRQRDDFNYTLFSEALQSAIDWIAENLEPEEVFPEKKLVLWAEENGFTSEE